MIDPLLIVKTSLETIQKGSKFYRFGLSKLRGI